MNIRISSLRMVPKNFRQFKPDALISIGRMTKRGNQPIEYSEQMAERSLFLHFDDAFPVQRNRRSATVNDVRLITDFIKRLPEKSNLLIHCKQGRSRSTATGLIAFYFSTRDEKSAVDLLFKNYPKSNPNDHILKIFDSFEGTMLFRECGRYKVKWKE